MLRELVCWNCGAEADGRRVAAEVVLHGRPRAEGGPYRSWRCIRCDTENGVLPGPRGGVVLYPLSGLRPSSIMDRFLSAAERFRLARSQAWWAVHREAVDAFGRGETPGPAEPLPPPAVRPTTPRDGAPRGGPRRVPPQPRPRPAPEPAGRAAPAAPQTAPATGPRSVLGVPATATRDEIRRAFRRLAKRHHPDRAGPGPEPAARFRAIRAAYDELMRETGEPRPDS